MSVRKKKLYGADRSWCLLPQIVASVVIVSCACDLSQNEVSCHAFERERGFWPVRLEAKALFAPCQSNLSCMSASEKTHIMLAYSEEPGNLGCPFSLSLHFWKPCVVSMLPCPYRSWQPGAAKRLCLFVFPSSHLSVCWAAKEMQLRRVLVMFDSVCPSAFFYVRVYLCLCIFVPHCPSVWLCYVGFDAALYSWW